MITDGQSLTSGALMPSDIKVSPSVPVFMKSVSHNPAAAAQATITVAARTGWYHVAAAVFCSIAAGATAQTPIHWFLRDGLTGAGAILASGVLSAAANNCAWIESIGFALPNAVPGTAMTLEFEAASQATVLESVTLCYYDVKSE